MITENKEIKIAFFLNSFDLGGIERVTVCLANAYSKFYNVDIVVCKNKGIFQKMLSEKVNVIDLNFTKVNASIFKLSKYLKRYMPDILISNLLFCNIVSILAKKLSISKTKLIFIQHSLFDSETHNLSIFSFLVPFLMKCFYNKASAVVAVSESVFNWLKNIGIKKEILRNIFNPIDKEEKYANIVKSNISTEKYGFYFLFLGRFAKIKNIPFLINSFEIFCKNKSVNKKYKLLIVGDGPEKERIKKLINKKNLDNSCFVLDSITYPEKLIHDSKLVLMGSFSEAMPVTILEAFALDVPIVSTPAQGCLDVFKLFNYNFYTSTFDNIEEYASMMETALSYKNVIKTSENLDKIFGIEKIIEQWSILFNNLIYIV
jgi:glycosyltransferase involved in cell wall biosynthesis